MLDLGWTLTPIPSVLIGIGEDPQRHRRKAMRGWSRVIQLQAKDAKNPWKPGRDMEGSFLRVSSRIQSC